MNTFYSRDELCNLGIREYGENVYIGRNVILYHPEKLSIGHDVRIDDYSIISGEIKLHNYIHISHFCGLYGGQAGIEMCDFSGLSSKVTIYGESDDYSGSSMTNPMVPAKFKPNAISGKVLLQKHGIVGVGSVVLPGVMIAEGSSVGSMSLCIKDTAPWTINVGIPAKAIKDRKKDVLDLENKFWKEYIAAPKPIDRNSKYFVGQKINYKKRIIESEVNKYAEVSGDFNPIHLDSQYARKTRFGKKVVHGMLLAGYVSKLIGNDFPGQGTIYISQELKFIRPTYIGDYINIVIDVKEIRRKNRLVLKTSIYSAEGKLLVDGEAEVIAPD